MNRDAIERSGIPTRGRQRDSRSLVSALTAVTALVTLAADQFTKATLVGGLPGVGLAPAINDGAVFGLLPTTAPVLALLSIAIMLAIAWQASRVDPLAILAGGIVIGGICGNVIDRLRYGYVIDFLYVDAPWLRNVVFNLADVAIFAGLAVMAWALTRGKGRAARVPSGERLRGQLPTG